MRTSPQKAPKKCLHEDFLQEVCFLKACFEKTCQKPTGRKRPPRPRLLDASTHQKKRQLDASAGPGKPQEAPRGPRKPQEAEWDPRNPRRPPGHDY